MNIKNIVALQQKRMGLYGDAETDINFENFEDNPAYREVEHNSKKIGVHFITKTHKDGRKEIYVISKPNNRIEVGDYIKDSRDKISLCYSADDFPIRKNYMALCDHTLTFQDRKTLEIHKLPCVLTNKTSPSFDGTKSTKYFILPEGQILIIVPDNEYTKQIQTDQRIIFNHNKNYIFKVTDIDGLTEPGLITIAMKSVVYDANRDNLELNISDYQSSSDAEDEPIGDDNITIQIDGADTMNSFDKHTYTAKVFVDGVEDDTKTVTFSVSQDIEGQTINIISQDGHSCVLQADNQTNWGNFKLIATLDEDEIIFVEKSIELVWL